MAHSIPRISAQLWSVKEELQGNYLQTLCALSKAGFEGVEFAGEFGPFSQNPEGLRLHLDELNLSADSAHVKFEALNPFNLETIEFYRALGVKKLIIPWDEKASCPYRIIKFIEDLNELAEKLEAFEMCIGYHNHADEWKPYQNATYFDHIASRTSGKVILQQDVGWTLEAGQDPAAFFKRYPARSSTTHFKSPNNNASPIIGKDGINWETIYHSAIENGGAQWIVIEQEVYPYGMSPIESLIASRTCLDLLLSQRSGG